VVSLMLWMFATVLAVVIVLLDDEPPTAKVSLVNVFADNILLTG